ncbi:MAG: hypothetical protein QOF87_4879 [Pseudonocardiales bacterium]|nr:hypothetical protein [Pseudonocardiales bacterium]
MATIPESVLGDVEITYSHDGAVAQIGMHPSGDVQYKRHGDVVPKYFPKHKEVGEAILSLREVDQVRVIVLTGLGDMFFIPPSRSPGIGAHADPREDWLLTIGLQRTFSAIIEVEKPIVAKVNGDAVGYGSSLVFACDFVIANEDAKIADHHLGMGETGYGRDNAGVVPGDGGSVFVPLCMPPTMAKEYLLLARPFTGRELADRGIFNAAVPKDELDAAVDDFAARLIKRPPYALGWGKRALNRRIQENFNLTFDVAWAYEMLNIWMNREDEKS